MSDETSRDDGADHPAANKLFGWVANPATGPAIFWGVAALSVALVALDLVVDRHGYLFAESLGFYAWWGFASFAFVVLMGWPLGRLLRRGENYYGDAGGPPAGLDPALGPDAAPDAGNADGTR